jgi:hypothetical protein
MKLSIAQRLPRHLIPLADRSACACARLSQPYRPTQLPHPRPRSPALSWCAATSVPSAWPRRCAAAASTANFARSTIFGRPGRTCSPSWDLSDTRADPWHGIAGCVERHVFHRPLRRARNGYQGQRKKGYQSRQQHTRTPLPLLRGNGAYPLRCAERQSQGWWCQQPPRITR